MAISAADDEKVFAEQTRPLVSATSSHVEYGANAPNGPPRDRIHLDLWSRSDTHAGSTQPGSENSQYRDLASADRPERGPASPLGITLGDHRRR